MDSIPHRELDPYPMSPIPDWFYVILKKLDARVCDEYRESIKRKGFGVCCSHEV